MHTIYSVSDHLLSALGNDTGAHFDALQQQRTAIRYWEDEAITRGGFYAARLQADQLQLIAARFPGREAKLSPFEQMCLYVAAGALGQTEIDVRGEDCLLVLATTKGNIEWLGKQSDDRISLHRSAALIAKELGMKSRPLVVSNACISGSLALMQAARMLEAGRYRHAVVVGCDRFSSFVYSGFQSFHALADSPCRPFDKERKGINLGEAAACMILSADPGAGMEAPPAILAGGGASNDANHLSGPSRTGAELSAAIDQAMRQAGVVPAQIGMLSAHGTATVFNDEMEAKALTLSGLASVPLHSFKSYIGHTLGAAGIIESVVACKAMQSGKIPASLGFAEQGVSHPVNVVTRQQEAGYDHFVKTASGFGGCNAALVWRRYPS